MKPFTAIGLMLVAMFLGACSTTEPNDDPGAKHVERDFFERGARK